MNLHNVAHSINSYIGQQSIDWVTTLSISNSYIFFCGVRVDNVVTQSIDYCLIYEFIECAAH